MKVKSFIATIGFLVAALIETPAEAGWKCCKIHKNDLKVSRHDIKRDVKRIGKEVGRAAKKLEQKTRRFRKTLGDVNTFGYTRYLRKKGEAMAREAYARAQAEAWEDQRYMEVSRLLEKQSYIGEVIGQQQAYIGDVSRALELQNVVLQTARVEIANRTLIGDLQVQLTSLMTDQEQAFAVLMEAIQFNQNAIEATSKSAEVMHELRLNYEVAPIVEAGGSVTDTTVVADAVTVNWDDSLITLAKLAKSRNKNVKQYIQELVKLGEKSELEKLVQIVSQVKATLMGLKTRIESDKHTNQLYSQSILLKLKNAYGIAEPTQEQMEKAAKEREEEEKKLIEEMMKERQQAVEEQERIARQQHALDVFRQLVAEAGKAEREKAAQESKAVRCRKLKCKAVKTTAG